MRNRYDIRWKYRTGSKVVSVAGMKGVVLRQRQSTGVPEYVVLWETGVIGRMNECYLRLDR